MSLEAYKKKRNFSKTPEPPPRSGRPHRRPIFVVQEHHASRLHYDFRLQAEGVLKSWAVPKEPSLDPSVKRLAVRVEDHPLEYAEFSGEIPEGQYGSGIVKMWDRGTYENLLASKAPSHTISEGIEAGHLEVALHGRKLRGAFALVRMRGGGKKENWLLFKMKDKQARSGAAASQPDRSRRSSASPAVISDTKRPRPKAVKFTHEDKVMFPEPGITKGEVLRFYERIAEYLLPHLRERPATLERLPEGVVGMEAPHFWQKHTPAYYPTWIPRVELPSELGKPVKYIVVNDLDTLLYLVNQGTLTFHVWLSRLGNLDRPDFVLFDLDPGQAPFADVVAIAQRLHSVLNGLKVESCVKTSGKSGLHVLAPWGQEGDYEEARAWAMHAHSGSPQIFPTKPRWNDINTSGAGGYMWM